jgi:hypothetical protein
LKQKRAKLKAEELMSEARSQSETIAMALSAVPIGELMSLGVGRRELGLIYTGVFLALRVPLREARELARECVDLTLSQDPIQ